MTIERKIIQPEEQLQMYIIFIKESINIDMFRDKMIKIGGQPFQHFPKHSMILVQLPVKSAESLKYLQEIKHIGPVILNSRVKKLKVKTDLSGNPLWHYKVDDDNNIYMVKNK